MKYLLDTDHISIIQSQSEPGYSALVRKIRRYTPADFGYSIVSFHEQVIGCHDYINRARNYGALARGYEMLIRALRDYDAAEVLPFDGPATVALGGLSSRLRVGKMDLRIASIALSRGLVLLTRNVGDFGRIPGLVTEDWTN
jgi:tRNA(fMet)-specific endonuclease VapC